MGAGRGSLGHAIATAFPGADVTMVERSSIRRKVIYWIYPAHLFVPGTISMVHLSPSSGRVYLMQLVFASFLSTASYLWYDVLFFVRPPLLHDDALTKIILNYRTKSTNGIICALRLGKV